MQIKINYSKFIVARLQQRCHMTLLVSMFVKARNFLLAVFLLRKIISLTKNNHIFQASVTERCASLSKSSGIFRQNPLRVRVKKLNIWKNFATRELLHKKILRFPVRFLSLIYRSLLVWYNTNIFCIRIHICQKYFFLLLLFLRWKAKESFWITFATWFHQFI